MRTPDGSDVTTAADDSGPATAVADDSRAATADADGVRSASPAPDAFSPVPRWTRDPAPGTAEHRAQIPGEVLAGLRALGERADLTAASVLLAAHAKVLAALTGRDEVVTGYVAAPGARPAVLRLPTGRGSWWTLIRAAHREADEAARQEADREAQEPHRAAAARPEGRPPPDGAGRGAPPETVLDPTGGGGPDAGALLRITLARHGRELRLRYRTDVLDADCAARVAGYHLTALSLIVSDPDAPHHRASLLSDAERRLQLDGLSGPRRALPDLRVHELFEERVRERPDAVAAEQEGQRWTYRELDVRANRIAHALRARGARGEDVVAVVSERGLPWMAAVLAVLKAGCAYLPVEPHFPADRIGTMLTRASCRLVLTATGSTATLDEALSARPGTRALSVEEAWAERRGDDSPAVETAPDALAYVFFTSGSTGEPKGAMCEQAGMANHLHAKIHDLGIGAGDIVAQIAPPCFDISLWQLLAGPLAGGRTLLVGQDTVLDAGRFLDTIEESGVTVLQVVPSYLDAVLTLLERHPRDLPALRCVSVTGEALKPDLVRRWFAARPGVPLVNAYGLTETCDDTHHAVLERLPDTGRVPLGRPVQNVRAHIVDEHLSPVPLGAPGEIVVGGVCVGRGYVGDPERTRASFLPDPHHPGERLYRSGDFGRWLPDGTMEFLGRRDSQVKIRGFRIETGEIENTLLRIPGVHDAAVVVTRAPGRPADLVAFCAGPRALADSLLHERLAASLPPYMVPPSFHWRRRLPLTANGKTDRNALRAQAVASATAWDTAGVDAAAGPTAGDGRPSPGTPTEQRIAAAWSTALGVPRGAIGRHDDFFDRGGTSLAAVKVAIALDRAISPKDLTRCPVLADLAALVDRRRTEARSRPAGRPAHT
ncbi:amino acid adenylation domain-containing protein [Streptomyces sp. CS7]|uniref:non-ribosomal peptide synthetase n=1 Tax=Streptomyces TaxID=1883 RepID=UPI0021B25A9C|nr:amino acid adenylation domain-containing protein [Streptomyces sp. CS-7]MCT6778036.1 amino acid adenylation domain-containing protein [Streptomyces sp. CS-7]